eukprot:Gb_06242 [translate_table: standard]
MDRADLSLETFAFQNPVLGYARIGILAMANSLWTWMVLVLTAVLSLWRWRGVKGFSVAFTWWGKHAQVRVMLQSFSSSSSSPSNHDTITEISSVFSDDDLHIGRNMYMDDLDLMTYRKQSMNDRGIYRRSKSKSKSSSTFDSLTLCNSFDSECLDANRRNTSCILETEMVFIFEKSSWPLPNSAPVSPLGFKENLCEEQGTETPSSKKWDYLVHSFGNRNRKDKQVWLAEECRNTDDGFVHDQSGKDSFSLSSSMLIFEGEGEGKCKGSSLVFYDDEEAEGDVHLLNPYIGLDGWRRLVSFENQYGWDKLLSVRLGFEWNYCTKKSGLNLNRFSKFLVRNNVVKVWDGQKRSLMKLLCIPEDIVCHIDISWSMSLSSSCTIDNSVRLWDLQVAKCLNEFVINKGIIMGTQIQDNHDFLLSGSVTTDEGTSVFLWDSRNFRKPVSFYASSLGYPAICNNLRLNDKLFSVYNGLNSTFMYDLRMLGASPIELLFPAKLQPKNLPLSSHREETARPMQSNFLEDFLLNDDDDICEDGSHGISDSGKSSGSSLFKRCIGAVRQVAVLSVN